MVCTSEPHAVEAGLEMLARGGNAIDAAVAMAAALTVVEPTSNGLGSDAFAIVWDGQQLHGLNGSGRAPTALDVSELVSARATELPKTGWLPVTVPGAVDAWHTLSVSFGNLDFAELLQPAIRFAEQGFTVSPVVAHYWALAARRYLTLQGPEYAGWAQTFAPGGQTPKAGEVWRSPDHAKTLRLIGESDGMAFYFDELASAIVHFSQATGGILTEADLSGHAHDWVTPLSVPFMGHEVWELPPNGQGIAALMALGILDGIELAGPYGSAESWHPVIEAVKRAMTDAYAEVADPAAMRVTPEVLLDRRYAASCRQRIGDRAMEPIAGRFQTGGTVYLCTADADGMMVSFIQSNFHGFGSGIVIPGTGIALQNRGYGFSLDPEHPNFAAPNKRPFHTIIPGFLTKDGKPVGPFGVMGGHMQPQGHVQVLLDTLKYGMDPQAALDAPRWRWDGGLNIAVEDRAGAKTIEGLRAKGHAVTVEEYGSGFGRGQIIWRDPDGGYIGGSDPRADGYVGITEPGA